MYKLYKNISDEYFNNLIVETNLNYKKNKK